LPRELNVRDLKAASGFSWRNVFGASSSPQPQREGKPTLLLFSFWAGHFGGQDYCVATAIDQLKRDYDITLVSFDESDVDRVNWTFGTDLAVGDFRRLDPPALLKKLGHLLRRIDPTPASIWDQLLLMRYARFHSRRFDAVVSFSNEIDLGVPLIQYVHYPWIGQQGKPDGPLRPWHWVSGFRYERVRRNTTLANSSWTARRYSESYGASAHVVPPPVSAPTPRHPSRSREESFLCIGRISKEKRLELVIEVLARVRAEGHPVKLRIVGPSKHPDYEEALRSKALEAGEWVEVLGEVSRARLDELLLSNRYGIHAMDNEHFGIAVAELMRAGCIVFSHSSGGPAEILGGLPQLLYDDQDDAVEKILAMLNSEELREATRVELRGRADTYSPERFGQELRTHIEALIAAGESRG